MNIESRWRLLAFWSAKDVPQVHCRRLQVMLKKKQASKPRKQELYTCCAADQSTDGQYQSTGGKDQSTGGSNQSTDSPQEHCAGTVHKDQSTDVPVSRLMVFLKVWAVDWGSDQSIGSVPGAADAQEQSTAFTEQSTGGTTR